MPALRARRASASIVLLATMTGFSGAGGWAEGRMRAAAVAELESVGPEATPVDPHAGHEAPTAAAAGDDALSHHAHHGRRAAAPTPAARPQHDHDCEKGVCRCDSRCPTRRTGPCGGALRSCQGERDEAGPGPAPVRPFLLSAAVSLRPVFESLDRPDVSFVPLTRALEPVSPPPRSSFV